MDISILSRQLLFSLLPEWYQLVDTSQVLTNLIGAFAPMILNPKGEKTMKFIHIASALALVLAATSVAQAQEKKFLNPIVVPTFASAPEGWKTWANACYEQANKRRKMGQDVQPLFSDVDGSNLNFSEVEGKAVHCHVAGTDELAAELAKKN